MDTNRANNIKSRQTPELQRSLVQASEPVISSWLGTLPIATQSQGFNLNKGEFQDSFCLQYSMHMQIQNLPSNVHCGMDFDTTHALNCKRGGFVNSRPDNIRHMEFRLLQEVCTDVETEPHLQKDVNKVPYNKSANTDDHAG